MDVFDRVAHLIEELGEFACREQGTISRSYKDDGSVLTATDTAINEQVTEALLQLFPTANIVAEEAPNPFNDNAP
ncbi:MAG: inositol monophosphatase, partial [Sphaerochaetaceae bacterium]